MHWVADDLVLYELVDPETDEAIPLEDGAEGEACFTSIGGVESMLLVRQSVGDIHRVEISPCPCGRTGMRYRVIGRTDDMLKVKGVMVYPAAIQDVVASFGSEVTGEFRIVLDEPPPRVTPPLRLRVERAKDLPSSAQEDLDARIRQAMHSRLRITPDIEWLPAGTLARAEHKTTLFERTYE
jgi:phenylacetate-CoA ligase